VGAGVDVEVMSATKFMSGGATAFGGVVIDNGTFDWDTLPTLKSWNKKFGKDALMARLRKEIFRHLGGAMAPQTAHYMNLGLDVMALRVERCVSNCLHLGAFLKEHSQVKRVDYPGLPDHPSHRLAMQLYSNQPGAVMTFDLKDQDACFRLINRLQVIRRATNLNDNKSLIIHPYSTIYSEFAEEDKNAMGVRSTLLRLSVGIEDVRDLIDDLQDALSE
jgi:O-acetylhomoserine (thiol)-lyase